MSGTRRLVSLDDVSMEEIEGLMTTASALLAGDADFHDKMAGRVLCPVFFQDSSRTFINSTASFLRMGGVVLPLNVANTRIGDQTPLL